MLARWHNAEAALMMTSGYSANEGLRSTIIEPDDWVAWDEWNHASIIDGLRLRRPERFVFRHNDLTHLEDGLRTAAARKPARERFIVTESLFSMEGDRVPLRDVVVLAAHYGAHVIVDEAHATGCFGPRGRFGRKGRLAFARAGDTRTGEKRLGFAGATFVAAAERISYRCDMSIRRHCPRLGARLANCTIRKTSDRGLARE